MRPQGTPGELEQRRRLAVARLKDGYTQTAVAQFLGVHVRTVRRWWAGYRTDGESGLAAQPHPGPPPRLTPRQQRTVLSWFRKSPQSFGFVTELWTAPRVAQVIQRKFGVRYHPRYLNRWLKDRGITPQKPQRRARERDAERMTHWLTHDWPRIQNRRAAAEPIWS